MERFQIKCSVEPLSRKYVDGLERVELYVCSEFIGSTASPEKGQRLPLKLLTPQGTYPAGLQNYQGREPYLCPDLVSAKSGRRVSLARTLDDNAISPRQIISVLYCGRQLEACLADFRLYRLIKCWVDEGRPQTLGTHQ